MNPAGKLLDSSFILLPSSFPVALALLIHSLISGTREEENMHILGWIIFGLIVGAIAKLLMPGHGPGGWIVTILLGIAGSFVGGFLATAFLGYHEETAGWIGSIVGAMILLLIYRLIVGRRTVL